MAEKQIVIWQMTGSDNVKNIPLKSTQEVATALQKSQADGKQLCILKIENTGCEDGIPIWTISVQKRAASKRSKRIHIPGHPDANPHGQESLHDHQL